MEFTLQDVEAALALPQFDPEAAQAKMIPVPRARLRAPEKTRPVRQGAVLLLLYPVDDRPHVILTRRPDSLRAHAGQISLPGGSRDPGETLADTALRETEEEIGVAPSSVRLLGRLGSLYIPPTDFEVHPFVGWRVSRPTFRPSPVEVAELIEVPIVRLVDPAVRLEETWELRGTAVQVPYFAIDDHKVWGATAMMLSEFTERLKRVSRQQ